MQRKSSKSKQRSNNNNVLFLKAQLHIHAGTSENTGIGVISDINAYIHA